MDYENLLYARKKKLYRLFAVSFGILCILQAAVNISLRLALYSDFEAIIKNLTEEGENWKRKRRTFNHYSQHGWVYFNHSFYYISSIGKSWQEGRDDCQQRGADLIIINNKEEQDFARKFKRRTWIGLTDKEIEDYK
ncbi:natural killer cells antigen CD94-like [Perca flavescens]|uniref:natural killer cells antigen CD94-like n=1 Tax=Perca flavescens TaxID=8167 RepID=UPI00106E0333|nr:natural killer cells antigen CD94-like [Perca flavescens]